MRDRGHTEHLGDWPGESAIVVLRPGHLVLVDEVLPLLLIGIEAYGRKHEAGASGAHESLPYIDATRSGDASHSNVDPSKC